MLDDFGLYVINCQKENLIGQFVFPKSILIKKGIVATETKDGKRGFRVYPKWDKPISQQAIKIQKRQLNYFYEINDATNYTFVKNKYSQKLETLSANLSML